MKKQNIDDLKTAIENKLNWGPVENWTNYDFEKLTEEIYEVTKVNLSITTLKRFFGKVKYDNKPSITTLNVLSTYLEYKDWRYFEGAGKVQEKAIEKVVSKPIKPSKIKFIRLILLFLAGIIIIFLSLALLDSKNKITYDPLDFSFSSKTIRTKGLPNSVIFDYDATTAKDEDTVFISQNWDISRKIAVDKNAFHHSSIYYYPGYFRSKLLVDKQIVKEHDIQISTDGWLGLVASSLEQPPLYFSTSEIIKSNEVGISFDQLKMHGINFFPELPDVRFFNQQDLNGFNTENFIFETEVKTGFSEGKAACQHVEIYLQAKDDILFFPLCRPECAGSLTIRAFGNNIKSQNTDLSGFGCNLDNWVKVSVVCRNRHLQFIIDQKIALEIDLKNPANEIVGIQYRFQGPGSIRNAKLTSGQQSHEFK